MQTQHENSTKMLAQYSKNIRRFAPIDSGVDLVNNKFQVAWSKLADDIRLSDIDLNRFESPTVALVHIILQGRGIHRQAVARYISLETCISRPSLIGIKNSGSLDEGKIIKLIATLIADVASYFEVKTSDNIEEMTWYVYEFYGHLSLEDLILFCQNCKDRKFTNKYQHVNAKGVNPEFLQIWLREYDSERQEKIKTISRQFRSFPFSQNEPTPTFWEDTATLFSNAELARKKRNSKLRELQLKQNDRKRDYTAKEKLIDFFVNDVFFFQLKHNSKTTEELVKVAHEKSDYLVKKWTNELQQRNYEKSIQQPTENDYLEKYLMVKMKAMTLKVTKKKRETEALQIIRFGISQVVAEQKIQHGYQLINALYCLKQTEGIESLHSVKCRLIIELQRRMAKHYKEHLTKIVNEEVSFITKEKYYQKWAWLWVCEKCLSKVNAPKDALSLYYPDFDFNSL